MSTLERAVVAVAVAAAAAGAAAVVAVSAVADFFLPPLSAVDTVAFLVLVSLATDFLGGIIVTVEFLTLLFWKKKVKEVGKGTIQNIARLKN